MSAPDYMYNLYAYNEWANRRVLAAVSRVSDARMRDDIGAGSGSMLDALRHTVGAQSGWLAFWRGESYDRPVYGASHGMADLIARFDRSHDDLRRFLDAMPAAGLDAELVDDEGAVHSRWKQWHLLLHVVNHGTQHRAEAGVALAEAGESPGDLDYGHFCDERASADAGSVEIVRALYEYTAWADERLLSAMDGMSDDELLARHGDAGFSIGLTLLDAMLAQRGWLRIWSGYEIEVELPGAPDGGHMDNLRDGFRRMHQAIGAFIDTLTDDTLAEMREIRPDRYNNWTWNERRLWDEMIHVVNHTTQHRSEAALALTRMGRSPGDLELDELMVVREPAV